MTPEAKRRRARGQLVLLVAGLVVLIAVSASSVVLVDRARSDNARVFHTIEVENQIATLLLQIRQTESAARGYLLTTAPALLNEYESGRKAVVPAVDHLVDLFPDNPVQVENGRLLRPAVDARLAEFATVVDFAKRGDIAGGIAAMRPGELSEAGRRINDLTKSMRSEERRLLALRTANADQTEKLASTVTVAGSALIVLLGGISIFLLRRSTQARDVAETQLRDNNLNLENAINERTFDLREANNEIQRFAYIVSHDLRSPLVNIMGFTSELRELRHDIFRRIAALQGVPLIEAAASPGAHEIEPALGAEDRALAKDFTEALGFIQSSIDKMDRLIAAILNLTREGRRNFEPVHLDMRKLIEGTVATLAHQAAEANATIDLEALPDITSDRLALEQIFSNLIDNALKYLKPTQPGHIVVRGRTKLGYAIYEVTDNGRGIDPKDHQRIFDLFRRAGVQDRPGQGIGLAHVRALVRRLGGTMSVASQLGHGSTFTITLPIRWKVPVQREAHE